MGEAPLSVFLLVGLLALSLLALFISLWLLRQRRPLVPTLSYVETPSGVRIHYQDVGRGQPLVFLHGIGASLYCWSHLLPLLQKDFRLILLDLPGFGASDKPVSIDYSLEAQCERIMEFLDQLQLKKVTLVGSSMGGALALWLGKSWPERFNKLIVLAPATDPQLVPLPFGRLAGVSKALSWGLSRWMIGQALHRVRYRQDNRSPEDLDRYWAPYDRSPEAVRAFLLATQAISDPRLPQGLANLNLPLLVLWGQRDRMVPRRSIDQLLRVLPQAQLLTHSEAGHHLQEDQPEWTASEIQKFVRSSV